MPVTKIAIIKVTASTPMDWDTLAEQIDKALDGVDDKYVLNDGRIDHYQLKHGPVSWEEGDAVDN